MQRRDPRTFLEGVLAQVSELPPSVHEQLFALVDEKSGTKRAAKIAQIIAAVGHSKAEDEDEDEEEESDDDEEEEDDE
jgi:hypothetical protein